MMTTSIALRSTPEKSGSLNMYSRVDLEAAFAGVDPFALDDSNPDPTDVVSVVEDAA